MPDNAQNPAQIRGFAVYVGVDEAAALAAGTSISEMVDAVRNVVTTAVPGTESHAAVAYAPHNQRGKNLDIVRLALREPRAVAELLPPKPDASTSGVTIDLSRKRVVSTVTSRRSPTKNSNCCNTSCCARRSPSTARA